MTDKATRNIKLKISPDGAWIPATIKFTGWGFEIKYHSDVTNKPEFICAVDYRTGS